MLTKLSPDTEYNHNFKKNSEVIWNLIEEKWIGYWAKNKINNSDLDYSKGKVFITVAYPYPNSLNTLDMEEPTLWQMSMLDATN